MMPPGMKMKSGMTGAGDGKPKPPGMAAEMPMPEDKPAESGGKASREKALVIDENHRCDNCQNYDPTSGECGKVEGYFDPGAACLRFFKAMSEGDGHDEPDADDAGGASDDDADDK